MPGTVLKESVSVLGPGGRGLTGGQAAGVIHFIIIFLPS